MQLPTRLKGLLYDYSIEEYDEKDASRDRLFGSVTHDVPKIKISTSYGHRRAAETLLHEIMHIVENKFWYSKDSAERRVEMMSEILATMWRDNPEVFNWIGEGLINGD